MMDTWVKAFPNPTTGQLFLQVQMEAESGLTIQLLDGMGRSVKQWTAQDPANVELDIREVPSGLYFVEVTNGSQREIIRVIKD